MDYAYKQTDVVLAELEKRIKNVYGDAAKELQTVIDEYFEKLKSRDEHQRKLLEEGQITKEQYRLWRMAQLGRGERFEALRDEIARRCNQANQVALAYVNDSTPGIYSLNYNYSAYTIEQVHGNVGFTLIDEQTVRRLIAEDPELLPASTINIPKDLKWNREKLQRELVTGIMLGESTGEIADRFQRVTDMNRVSALRNARTAVTSAQNAGRQESYNRAADMGLKIRKRWIATKDMRTRHSHGMMDGQTVNADECFISELGSEMMYPGDREHGALACDVYNCRCAMRTVEKEGIEAEPRQMRVRNPKWEAARSEELALQSRVEKLRDREKTETDPEKKKKIRQERLAAQKELSAATKKRQGLDKNVVVNEMTYSDWIGWKQSEFSLIEQAEKSIKYGDAAVFVDKKYVSSQAYRMKYRGVTSKARVDDIVCKYSREILTQKSGTENEVLILIDADNGNLIYRKNNRSKNRVDYSKRLLQAIEKAKQKGQNILAIHNHPNGYPPTADDCVSAAIHGYSIGVACGHNGKVYTYKPADIVYSEKECSQIHNAISLQLQGTPYEDIDKVWLEMLKLFQLEADVR